MNEQKKQILDKINLLIEKRKTELLQRFPHIHEIEDGIIVRFFTNWENCSENEEVKYKTLVDKENPESVNIFHFIPKGTKFKLEKRQHIHTLICMSGNVDITTETGELIHVKAFSKTKLQSDTFSAVALEDTYMVTLSK